MRDQQLTPQPPLPLWERGSAFGGIRITSRTLATNEILWHNFTWNYYERDPMRHQIKSNDPRAPEMAEAIEKCVHCGFCLAACPTYKLLGEEMDSPPRPHLSDEERAGRQNRGGRGPALYRPLPGLYGLRTRLSFRGGLWRSAGELPNPARTIATSVPLSDGVARRLIIETLPYPRRFRLAMKSGKIGRALQPFLLPEAFASMLNMLPDKLPPPSRPCRPCCRRKAIAAG